MIGLEFGGVVAQQMALDDHEGDAWWDVVDPVRIALLHLSEYFAREDAEVFRVVVANGLDLLVFDQIVVEVLKLGGDP